jgi:chromosome segregation ATPase
MGHLPRVRLKYDRVKTELNSSKAELSSWKAAISNEVRVYQDFCNRNLVLKKREDELQLTVKELEAKENELQRTISGLKQQLLELREFNEENNTLDLDIKQEKVNFTNDVFILPPNMVTDYSPRVEPSSRTLIFDTKDLSWISG